MGNRLEALKGSPVRYIIPNALTASRPFLAGKAAQSIEKGEKGKALALIGVAWLTDAEGLLARRLNAVSLFGKIIDPVADLYMQYKILKALEMAGDTEAAEAAAAAEMRGENLTILDRVGDAKAITAVSLAGISLINVALFGLSKLNHGKVTEPSPSSFGKVKFTINAAGAARLIYKPEDKFASWAIAGASAFAFGQYVVSAVESVKTAFSKNQPRT